MRFPECSCTVTAYLRCMVVETWTGVMKKVCLQRPVLHSSPRENLLLLVSNMAAMRPLCSAAAICTHSLLRKFKYGLHKLQEALVLSPESSTGALLLLIDDTD